jgi:DNA polymerase I-like protein with 3'-5' exonuclease and polymerase domains
MPDILQWLYDHPDEPASVDTETTGLNVHDGRDHAIGVSIACRAGSLYVAYHHVVGENADESVRDRLEWVLSDGRTLIFANRTFDVLALESIGIFVNDSPFYDVFTMSRLIDPSDHDKEVTLDDLSKMWCGEAAKITDWEWTEYNDKGRPIKESTLDWQKKNGWPTTTPEMIDEYACVDAVVTFDVWEAIMAHPHWKANPPSVWERKQKTMRTSLALRRRGALLDLDLVHSELEIGLARKAELLETMQFNPKSHKDNMRIFIDELGLPPMQVSKKTGLPSFKSTVMAEYEPMLERMESPLAAQVKEYRGWDTATGLLLRPWSELVSPDGRLRTEFTTHVTATGRLSSRKPNLQQISKESNGKRWKENIKRCIIAKPGYSLVSFDYSQLELRLAVAYAEEPTLQQVFEEGRDIFTEMSEELGMSRQDTKTFVYSIQYGAGIPRIMNAFGVSEMQARKMKANFYRTYPRFRALDAFCRDQAAKYLQIPLWSGRIRYFMYPSENYKAMNALIQGGAADVVECVWNYVMDEIDNEDCQMLLQVHDALVFEIRNEVVDHYTPLILATMEDVQTITGQSFPVRFAVEASDWALAA